MKTKISSKQKLIYSILIVAGLLYASYALFISGRIDNIKKVLSETVALQSEYRELEPYIQNKDVYIQQIDNNNAAIARTVDEFLPAVTHKDMIGYTQTIWDKYKYRANVAAYQDPVVIKAIDYAFEDDRSSIIMTKKVASITFEVEYGNLKKFLEEIKKSDLKMCITDFTASLDDSTNMITGNIALVARSIEGSEKKDTTYNAEKVAIGVKNIFGEYPVPTIF